jgi:hypothetical protein
MEDERKYNEQKKKDKRTHIDLQNSFTCAGLKYFVDIIRAFSTIRTNAIMRSLLFPYSNAEHVTSILAIFVNKKTEPVFVNIKATSSI